jgi:hypothetical protein
MELSNYLHALATLPLRETSPVTQWIATEIMIIKKNGIFQTDMVVLKLLYS